MKYGFYSEEYDDGGSCKTLMTGDGKALFTDLNFHDGLVGIGFSYGLGQGVGVLVTPPEGTVAPDIGVEFQVKFESQESIDSMIGTLLRVKNQLAINTREAAQIFCSGGRQMIYIDMDGVVADFDQSIVDIFGEEYSNKIADKFWKQTCVEAEVFRKMPPIPEGVEMVKKLAEKYQVCFMTSTGGMPHHIDIAKQKLDFLHDQGLGDKPIAFCMNTKGKGLYAFEGAILIDDREKVITEWDKQGGFGILFTREATNNIVKAVGILQGY